MNKKRILSLVTVCSLGAALAACSSGTKSSGSSTAPSTSPSASTKPAESPPAKPTGTFRFFINSGATWDPAIWDWGAHHDQIGIFEGLVHFSQGKIVPGMATTWKEDGNVWTFNLRHDAKFSNGDPIDADTFVYSIRRAVDPKTTENTGKSSSFFGDVNIKNWKEVRNGKAKLEDLGVKAVDKYTLQIELAEPDHAVISKLGVDPWHMPVDPKVVPMGPTDTSWTDPSKIVSNGPYMVDQLNVKTDMWLKANPNYYSKVSLEKIHMTWSNAQTKQLLVYKNNESDMATLSPEDVPGVKADSALTKELNWFDTAISYTFQVRHSKNPALENEKVRQALAMAIDKQGIADKVLNGTGVPVTDGSIVNWMADWIKDAGFKYDPQKAKELMKEAGYPDGKGFPTLVMLVPGSDDKTAQAVQQMWQENLGINVKYDGEEWGTYVTKFDQLADDNTVSVVQNGVGPKLTDWKETIAYQQPSSNDFARLAMDGATWQKYLDINGDTKLDAATKNQKINDFFVQNSPKSVMDQYNKGLDAYKKGDEAGMKDYVKWRVQSSYTFPIDTIRNGILLKPGVKGYFPQRMWLSTPPDWLNDITVK